MTRGSFIGQTLAGRFRLVELLGSGGMGEVYVAEHATLGRRYAIKLLHTEIESDPIVAERFRREAQATSRLDHPNIVTISDFGKTESGQLYLVMEYIRGKNLYEVIQEVAPGRLPLTRSLNILAQVVRAVGAAHEAGVVHRDLKPDNTLLSLGPTGDDVVKILDFGLAKIIFEADLTVLTKQGEVFGTPSYLSPEQALGVEIDHRTDLYSLGVMAYELCAGRLPFIAKSLPRLFIAHQREVPQPPSAYVPAGTEPIPPDLEQLILRCLEKDPQRRPSSTAELSEVIESLLPSRKDSARKIVPDIVPEVVPVDEGGTSVDSDWCEDTKTAADDVRMTVAMSGHAPDVQEVAEQRDGAREWYWSQVVKRSNALAHTLISKHLVGADLGRTVALLQQLEEKATSLETEIAVAESRFTELHAMTRESEARLRFAVVDLSMERGQKLELGAHPKYFADVDFQLQNLEQSLAGLFRQKESRGEQLEEAIRLRMDRLHQVRQDQTNTEIQLINLLHRERPPQVSPEIQSAYDRLADLLRTIQMPA